MEISIKEEGIFEPLMIISVSFFCCMLCHDSEKLLNTLAEHFREKHFEDFNQLPSTSIIELCNCADIQHLQSKLLDHLLKITLERSKSLLPSIDIDFKEEIKQENLSEDEFDEPKPKIRRNRKKKEKSTNLEELFEIQLNKTQNLSKNSTYIQCDLCPVALTTVQSFHKHLGAFHDPSNAFKCEQCSTGSCSSAKNLIKHQKVHSQDAFNLECDRCDAKFNSKALLSRHVLTHTSNYRNPSKVREKVLCQFCSQLISYENLKRHIKRLHSDNKFEFPCDFEGCGKAFTSKSMLRDHKNLHLGIRPWVCDYCGLSFAHSSVLRRHKIRHTNPERFKCDICDEYFVAARNVINHKLRKHSSDAGSSVKPFVCDFDGCSAAFKFESYLKGHKREVHIRKRVRVRGLEKKRWRLHDEVEDLLREKGGGLDESGGN